MKKLKTNFYLVHPADWEKLTAKEVSDMVADRLIQLADAVPNHIHSCDIGEAMVRRVLWFMRHIGAARFLSHQEICDLYFNEAWESCPEVSVTQEEAYQGLKTFCNSRKLSLPSRAFFDKAATRRLGETVHCLGPKGNLRGRSGWRLRLDVISGALSPSGSSAIASDKE